uniref:IQ domain-containing protein M n=1 Tax=Jaculus jaculus TaxID=51337 RepID=UPI001E1B151E|nr:IQ domain-containing protein M [Jaculus jaculus]
MASEEAPPTKPKCPTLEFTKQDFLQTAKFVIAKHHEKINENKVQGTSVNVFKNKHQKMKSYKYVPFEVNKKETLDVIQEHRMALRHIPKEPLRSDYFEEPSELQIAVQENHVLNIKEKYQLIDPFTKENVKLSTIMTDIDSVSKRMENERKHHGKLRSLEFLQTLPTYPGLPLQPTASFLRFQRESGTVVLLQDHQCACRRAPVLALAVTPSCMRLRSAVQIAVRAGHKSVHGQPALGSQLSIESLLILNPKHLVVKWLSVSYFLSESQESVDIHLEYVSCAVLRPLPALLHSELLSGKMYDWSGTVSSRFTGVNKRSLSASSTVLQDIAKTFKKKEPKPIEPEPVLEIRPKDVSKTDKLDSKVKRIGPHIEIFQVFQGRNRFIITKRVIKLITIIQGYIRGWLERKRIQRIMKKVLYHGPNLKAVMNMYRIVTRRVRHRLGLWKTRQIVNFSELEEWMDRKKFYETMFAKREDWQGLERSDLLKYFNECGHFPTQSQIDDCWELFHIGSPGRYSDMVKKPTAIEMLFTLYPPQGAKVRDNSRLRSTWLRPIVNGEEGYKYIVSGHPVLKRANIRIVGRLVANSVRERKMRQFFKS